MSTVLIFTPLFLCLSFLSILPFLLSPFPYPLYYSLQVKQFFDKGYVLVPSFFTVEEMQPAVEAVEECVDILANRLYLAGMGKVGGGKKGMDGWTGGWRERKREDK